MKVIKNLDTESLNLINELLMSKQAIVVPTETVYGLAADATKADAVKRIFQIKGRPQDNPLIVHVSNIEMMKPLVKEIPQKALDLANKFWPGPLTIILEKTDKIPLETSGGLNTVAIRIPNHPDILKIINYTNLPLAAPSANISGKPSPTTAQHCIDDLEGKVDLIVDGGSCSVGIESTVISLVSLIPTILRPGAVTQQQIAEVIGDVVVDPSVVSDVAKNKEVLSPGMKYKHYSPAADVTIIKSSLREFVKYVNQIDDDNLVALVFDEEKQYVNKTAFSYGKRDDPVAQSRQLFKALREIDKTNAKKVYARCPEISGIGLAVYNRLVRAAGFKIIEL